MQTTTKQKPAWYPIATVFEDILKPSDGLAEAQMDYDVIKIPDRMYRPVWVDHEDGGYWDFDGGIHLPDGHPNKKEVLDNPNSFHLARAHDLFSLFKTSVTERYQVITPSMMAENLDPFFDRNVAFLDSMYTLHEGTSEVICLRLHDAEQHCDEEVEFYLSCQNFHGSGAVVLSLTGHDLDRGCILNAPFGRFGSVKIKHTASAQGRLQMAIKNWEHLQKGIPEFRENMKLLRSHQINPEQVVDQLLKIRTQEEKEKASAQTLRKRNDILQAIQVSSTIGAKTLADIYYAITYVNTYSTVGKGGKTVNARLTSVFNGSRETFERNIFGELIRVAKNRV